MASASETNEVLIYAPIDNIINIDLNDLNYFQCVGIETEKPILAVGGSFYQCEYANSIGTTLFLEKNSNNQYELFGKTDKILKAKPLIVQKKQVETDPLEQTHVLDNLPDNYADALKLLESCKRPSKK